MSFIESVFHVDLNGFTMPKKNAYVQQIAQFQSWYFN